MSVYWDEIPKYVNDVFWEALYLWHISNKYGLPNGTIGWANEPLDLIQAVFAIDSAHNAYEVQEQERRQKRMDDEAELRKRESNTRKSRGKRR